MNIKHLLLSPFFIAITCNSLAQVHPQSMRAEIEKLDKKLLENPGDQS